MPVARARPSGAISSLVPTFDSHSTLPALRSTATIAPQGGLLQSMPSGDVTSARVMAKGAPRCAPTGRPPVVLRLGARDQRHPMHGAARIGIEHLPDRIEGNTAPVDAAAGHRKQQGAGTRR